MNIQLSTKKKALGERLHLTTGKEIKILRGKSSFEPKMAIFEEKKSE